MPRQIFVNLPVADLGASIDFFKALGFKFDPKFTNETGTCMIVGDGMFVMLLTRERFKDFTPKPVADARQSSEVLVCLSLESREEVDTMVKQAVDAGGSTYKEPEDHGFMYGNGFQDLDGHIWELVYMVPGGMP